MVLDKTESESFKSGYDQAIKSARRALIRRALIKNSGYLLDTETGRGMSLDKTLEFIEWGNYKTRFHAVTAWIKEQAKSYDEEHQGDWITINIPVYVTSHRILPEIIESGYEFGSGKLLSYNETFCPFLEKIVSLEFNGTLNSQCGTFVYDFSDFKVMVASFYYEESDYDPRKHMAIAHLPESRVNDFYQFIERCRKLLDERKRNWVKVIGGWEDVLHIDTTLDDVILPDNLKIDILDDITTFFESGVQVYTELRLNPFRKILFAGPPGTGKTTLCKALSVWAMEKEYNVIYVMGSDSEGGSFSKIHEALYSAVNSESPSVIVVEELDTYVQSERFRSQILNVLDGIETPINPMGTLLLTTTNHPEIIDDRILKRPGRIDRIFVMPDMKTEDSCIKMLKHYLGRFWQDEFESIAVDLIDKSGAFVREACIYVLTQAVSKKMSSISSEMIRDVIKDLDTQIEERTLQFKDDSEMGFGIKETMRNPPRVLKSYSGVRYRGYSS